MSRWIWLSLFIVTMLIGARIYRSQMNAEAEEDPTPQAAQAPPEKPKKRRSNLPTGSPLGNQRGNSPNVPTPRSNQPQYQPPPPPPPPSQNPNDFYDPEAGKQFPNYDSTSDYESVPPPPPPPPPSDFEVEPFDENVEPFVDVPPLEEDLNLEPPVDDLYPEEPPPPDEFEE